MRIATSQYHLTMSQTLQNAQSNLEHVMQQMSTGKRLLKPSDDPVDNVRLARISREQSALAQYRDNIGALSTRLTQNETALNSAVSDLMEARDLLVWASDGTNAADDVNAMAASLVSLRDSLLYATNTRDQEGRYLFSGTLSSTASIRFDGSQYVYDGNDETQQVTVASGVTQSANVNAREMAELLNVLSEAITALQTPGVNVSETGVRATLTAALKGTDDALDAINTKIARLGGQQNLLANMDQTHANVSVANQQAIVSLSQLDYAEAATRLNAYASALEATQKAYSKVSGLSLFNAL